MDPRDNRLQCWTLIKNNKTINRSLNTFWYHFSLRFYRRSQQPAWESNHTSYLPTSHPQTWMYKLVLINRRGLIEAKLEHTHSRTLTHKVCGILQDTAPPDCWGRVLTELVMHTLSSLRMCYCLLLLTFIFHTCCQVFLSFARQFASSCCLVLSVVMDVSEHHIGFLVQRVLMDACMCTLTHCVFLTDLVWSWLTLSRLSVSAPLSDMQPEWTWHHHLTGTK